MTTTMLLLDSPGVEARVLPTATGYEAAKKLIRRPPRLMQVEVRSMRYLARREHLQQRLNRNYLVGSKNAAILKGMMWFSQILREERQE